MRQRSHRTGLGCPQWAKHRINKPLPVNDKGLHHNSLQAASEKTATETAQTSADLPEDLRKIVASWNDLPNHVRATIMMLIDSTRK